jgi:diketogulonate reductase-like aldo/keto reductase
MKLYTEAEVDKIVRDAVTATAQGMYNWYASDHVFIVNKTTKRRIKNCEISTDKLAKPTTDFIYPLLAEKGIKFTPEL